MELKEKERLDDLQYKGLKIIQHPDKYCFTSDAVVLANLVKVDAGDKVIDLGAGSGIIAILIAAKTKAKHVTGLELQPDMADMAERSVTYNNLSNKVKIVNGDIKDSVKLFGPEQFDIAVSNPPYARAGSGEQNKTSGIAISCHEVAITQKEIITAAGKLLKFGGALYIINKCDRMAEIIYDMKAAGLEAKESYIVSGQRAVAVEPDTVVIVGKKGGKPGMKIYSVINNV